MGKKIQPGVKPSEIGAGYRRTAEEIRQLDLTLIDIVAEQHPLTVRSA